MDILNLRHELFWDLATKHPDSNKNRLLIIERVFMFGTMDELKTIILYYGIDTIKTEIINVGWFDNKTLHFASTFLKIPKSRFRCYKRRQSHPVYWD